MLIKLDIFELYDGFCILLFYDHVSWRLETGAVSQLVCFEVLYNLDSFLKHDLIKNLSSSHSHKNCLLFLVNGLKCARS